MSEAEEKKNKRPGKEESVPTASFSGSEKGPGGQIGPYKLLSILGEGGFAVVYLAEQQKPVRRRVALKVIKPGMDSKQVIARFEAERQALALLEHPNIAYIFHAGTTEAGRPYFVMEHVKGVPITEYCDRQKLNIKERLGLFLQVCEAVQHAHQKGIIHRDIKPSNILVCVQDEKRVPKIIDFGVAKAIAQSLTERTLFTEQGRLIGTPEYMSPEQAEMTNEDIDTRSDIYSLGVLLYELMTGVLPFEAEELRKGGLDHIRTVIREQEPRTPSTRLSRLTHEESTKLAQHRRTEPGVLQRRLRGDLEWIPLKAMEKDRTRRYGSAGEFAADIRRHLNHEPVVAGPPSTVYKIKKFVRRNRASVTAAAAVAAALVVGLVAGIVVSTIFAIGQSRARAAADEARQAEAQQRRISEAERDRAVEALAEAEVLLVKAVETRRRVLGEGHPDTLASVSDLGGLYFRQKHYAEAEPLLVEAAETGRRVLGEEHPRTLQYMKSLAVLYRYQGRYDQAEELLVEALEGRRRVLGEEHPDTLSTVERLVELYEAWGKPETAEEWRAKLPGKEETENR